MVEKDTVDSSRVAAYGVLGSVALVVIVLGLQALFLAVERGEATSKERPKTAFRQLAAEQRTQLSDYAWQNREKGVMRLPIERSMELLVDERAADVSDQDD